MGKLELVWPGKDQWAKPEPRLLVEKDRHESKIAGTRNGDNLLIYGENLLCLKALEQKYSGAMKCIYIDPPYNTQSSFIHYEDGMEHSAWLNMMKERLCILKRLLRKDGTIWISIDDSECHYLKILCDEIFGRQNFIADVIWQKKTSAYQKSSSLANVHDHILVYARDAKIWKPGLLPRDERLNVRYKNPDDDPRGPWMSDNLTVGMTKDQRPNQYYALVDPKTKRAYWPHPSRVWSYIPESMSRLIKEKRILFPKNSSQRPMLKRFLKELQDGVLPQTIWFGEDCGTNSEAKKEALSFNASDVFLTPKPERLIQRILQIATKPGDLVLDCFAGSGTTGAVAHKMGRRWIMIEINGPCRTHILPRLQKVIDGTDQGGISQAVDWKGGGGFRFCELAPSLLEKNSLNRWVVNKAYNSGQLAEAICLHMGYECNHHLDPWWLHGKASEHQFLHVTGSCIDKGYLSRLHNELLDGQSLVVYCAAFRGDPKSFPRITIKKIPRSILSKCEWGKDDYSRRLKKALQERATVKNKQKTRLPASSGRISVPLAASSIGR